MKEPRVFLDARGTFIMTPNCHISYTKKNAFRGGEIHPHDQHNLIIKGRVAVLMRVQGKEVRTVHGENETIVVPAHRPHMFQFLKDTFMIEYWDAKKYERKIYRPYRKIVEDNK